MSLPSPREENEGDGDYDEELKPCDFPSSHGFEARTHLHEKDTVSPTGIIDAFVPSFMQDHSLSDSDIDQSSLLNIGNETYLHFANHETEDTAFLPDFTSDIDPSHDDYNLPTFGRFTASTSDDAYVNELLGRQLAVPNSTLADASSMTHLGMVVSSTPTDSHHDSQEPPHRNHMSLFNDDTLLPHFDLQPSDPVLRHLDFGSGTSSSPANTPTSEASGDSLADTFQEGADMETTSAFQRTFGKAGESPLSSPSSSSSSSIDGTEESHDCNAAKAASLQESEDSRESDSALAVAENPTNLEVNVSSTLLKSNGATAKGKQQQQPYQRFSRSTSDPIFLSLDQVKDQDVFSGKHERGSTHPGNIKYRGLVAAKSPVYRTFASSERKKKTKMRDDIIQKVGGRFVDSNGANGLFQVLTRKKVDSKVSQALRDGDRTKKKDAAARRRKRQSNKRK